MKRLPIAVLCLAVPLSAAAAPERGRSPGPVRRTTIPNAAPNVGPAATNLLPDVNGPRLDTPNSAAAALTDDIRASGEALNRQGYNADGTQQEISAQSALPPDRTGLGNFEVILGAGQQEADARQLGTSARTQATLLDKTVKSDDVSGGLDRRYSNTAETAASRLGGPGMAAAVAGTMGNGPAASIAATAVRLSGIELGQAELANRSGSVEKAARHASNAVSIALAARKEVEEKAPEGAQTMIGAIAKAVEAGAGAAVTAFARKAMLEQAAGNASAAQAFLGEKRGIAAVESLAGRELLSPADRKRLQDTVAAAAPGMTADEVRALSFAFGPEAERGSRGLLVAGARALNVAKVPLDMPGSMAVKEKDLEVAAPQAASESMPDGMLAAAGELRRRAGPVTAAVFLVKTGARDVVEAVRERADGRASKVDAARRAPTAAESALAARFTEAEFAFFDQEKLSAALPIPEGLMSARTNDPAGFTRRLLARQRDTLENLMSARAASGRPIVYSPVPGLFRILTRGQGRLEAEGDKELRDLIAALKGAAPAVSAAALEARAGQRRSGGAVVAGVVDGQVIGQ